MKISKPLLSAILIGITVQTVVSCSKEKIADNKTKKEVKKEQVKSTSPYSCPACGMG